MCGNEDSKLGNMRENVSAVNIRLSAIDQLEKWSKKLGIVKEDTIQGEP